MTKPELGNKHQCQNCGTKFFDLNKNPITCPKCGTVFHAVALSRVVQRATVVDDDEVDPEAAADIVSLQDVEAGEDKVAADVDDEVELEDEEADETFLAEEEEDNDDVSDLIDGDLEDDEDR
nr:TIGR02300 family protein [Methyloferula stellata]